MRTYCVRTVHAVIAKIWHQCFIMNPIKAKFWNVPFIWDSWIISLIYSPLTVIFSFSNMEMIYFYLSRGKMNYYAGGQGGKRSENDDSLLELSSKWIRTGRDEILKRTWFCSNWMTGPGSSTFCPSSIVYWCRCEIMTLQSSAVLCRSSIAMYFHRNHTPVAKAQEGLLYVLVSE